MKYAVIFFLSLVMISCSSQEKNTDDQAGSATETISSEVIGSDMGYIVENAALVTAEGDATFSIKGALKLRPGNSQVMIIRTQSENGGFTELLALEFPAFAEGTRMDYENGNDKSNFWIFGLAGETDIIRQTGSIEGSIRLLKTEDATNTLGLNREVSNGVGEMEIVVMDIDNSDVPVEVEKKYAARFRLPMITLDELARINQPI
ncbi:MAG: hypothetical protein C0600_12565 [Ignavibacteria bacterium]|nr:MAG: hypothetical protein C0600_12565 [Ignavibacteria bacterium]